MHQWSQMKPDTLLKMLNALAKQGEKRRLARSAPQPEAPVTTPEGRAG